LNFLVFFPLFPCLCLFASFYFYYVFHFGFPPPPPPRIYIFSNSFNSCVFKNTFCIFIFIMYVRCFFLLIRTLKLLSSNTCLYLWIRLCGMTKDEFVIKIIHLHILATTIVHISPCSKGDQRRCNLLPSLRYYKWNS
jgi:hypothetical protein